MKNLTTLQNITAHGRHQEYSGREWRTDSYMKQLLTIISILFNLSSSLGQQSIEGIYSSKDGVRLTIKFTSNNKYYYKSVNCIGNTQDSGSYVLHGDTVSFQSLLNPKDIQSNFFISDNTWEHKKNKQIDTLYFSIRNYVAQGTIYNTDVQLNDSLLIRVDSLKYYDRKYYRLYINSNSDKEELKITVNGITKFFPLDEEIHIELIENRNRLAPYKDKMIIKRNKMYSLRMFKVFGKKHYIYKQ